MDDTKLGQKVRENREKREERNRKMHPIWLKEGQALKRQRESMRVSQKKLAQMLEVSAKLIRKIESGVYIQRRKPIVRAYQLTLENITMSDREATRILNAR